MLCLNILPSHCLPPFILMRLIDNLADAMTSKMKKEKIHNPALIRRRQAHSGYRQEL